jgi:nitroreductase
MLNEEQAVQFLRSPRSIHVFQDKPVEKEKIRRLIEIARYASTAINSQLVEWLVVSDKSRINKITSLTADYFRGVLKEDPHAAWAPSLLRIVAAWEAGYDAMLRNAPALVVASAPKEAFNGTIEPVEKVIFFRLIKNAPASAEAATRRQADARRPKS